MATYTVWICPECKSTDVRELGWVNPNDRESYEADHNTKYRCESCNRDLTCLEDVVLVEETHGRAVAKVDYLVGND